MPIRTIAVVEDEAVIADAVAARLRGEGFEVEVAGDGEAALEPVSYTHLTLPTICSV